MIDLLRELEDELRRQAPESAAALRPGLGTASIDALLTDVPQPVSGDVRDFYSWHNGTEQTSGSAYAELFTAGPMLPLEEALALRTGVLDLDGWDPRWLPMFSDERDYFRAVICGDPAGPLISGSFMDLPVFDIEYATLRDFVQSLLRRWRAGVYRAADRGGVDADYRALAAIRREEDGSGVDVTALITDLASGDEGVWPPALHRLRSRLYPDAVTGLVAKLEDPEVPTRYYVIELLVSIGDPAALASLQRVAANDADERLRGYAAKAIQAIRSGGSE